MVTINTSDDLLRVLAENPEWKAAVRREILTEELMGLPARFDRFVETQVRFNEDQRRFNEDQSQINADQRSFNEDQRKFNADQRSFNEDQLQFNADQRSFNEDQRKFNADQRSFNEDQLQFNADQRRFNERAEQFMDSTSRAIDRLRRDTGNMRASHARVETARDAGGIAHDMGFTIVRTLASDDLLAMVRSNETADLADGDLRSFRLADLVIEASEQNGATHFIAVEISYTADERDSNRALRNAHLLTRFTGHPARAAVASIRNDERIQGLIDSGQVYWHRLEDRDPDPE